jgi:hypothetical protein
MKLNVTLSPSGVHTDLVGSVGWNVWGELFSASDDQSVRKWNAAGEPEGVVSVAIARQRIGGVQAMLVPC